MEELQPRNGPGTLSGPFCHRITRMTALSNLLDSAVRPKVVEDLTRLVDITVANQSGLTGMALKSAVAAGKKADADAIPKGVNKVMPQIVQELEPFWSGYTESGTNGFGNYLVSREDDVVKSLLDAGDNATNQMPGALQKVYSSLRGKAAKIAGPALSELGDIIERYAR